jgi:hypothetical protein
VRNLASRDLIRWWAAGLLALAMALNYLDRQSLGVVIGERRRSLFWLVTTPPISSVKPLKSTADCGWTE